MPLLQETLFKRLEVLPQQEPGDCQRQIIARDGGISASKTPESVAGAVIVDDRPMHQSTRVTSRRNVIYSPDDGHSGHSYPRRYSECSSQSST
jgi:hypothetical protein